MTDVFDPFEDARCIALERAINAAESATHAACAAYEEA